MASIAEATANALQSLLGLIRAPVVRAWSLRGYNQKHAFDLVTTARPARLAWILFGLGIAALVIGFVRWVLHL